MRLKLQIVVEVGMAPGMPNKGLCRQWTVSDMDFEEVVREAQAAAPTGERPDPATARWGLVARVSAEASAYAATMMHPSYNNYVRLEWIWM